MNNKLTRLQLRGKVLGIAAMMVIFFGLAGQAQQVSKPKGSWRLLGTVQANRQADHDIIIIAGPHDYFKKLKFKVTDAPLQMQRMLVRYDDGGRAENIEIRYNIPKGGESRVIDLKGGKRKLKSVEFWYDTKGFLSGKADVILFGIK
jgi:hypothetical protein